MARPIKNKVDYFPHVTQTGKTIAILEARWGNDGYAFWFKTLELLGSSEGFSYDCNKPSDWEYLLSKTRVTEDMANAILKKLAEIDAIDAELWSAGIIWSDNFAANLGPVFDKRKTAPPPKPEFPTQKCGQTEVSVTASDGNTDSGEFPVPETDKGKERKDSNVKDRKDKATTPLPPGENSPETENETEAEVVAADKILSGQTDPEEAVADKDFAAVVQLLAQNICPVTSRIEADLVREWTEALPKRWITQAIRQAALSKARSIKYVDKILQSWRSKYRPEESPWLAEGRKTRASPAGESFAMRRLAEMAREAASDDTL